MSGIRMCGACGEVMLEDERHIHELASDCLCVTVEEGWRPCPENLCERLDHDHDPSRPWMPV